MSARRSAIRAACRAAAVPLWAADLVTVRGQCRGRVKRKRCQSRWGVYRVSLDFTGERVDRLATVECASCGRTWRRSKVPPLRSAAGYQTTRLTLVLPRSARRWFVRNRWHQDGDNATVVRDASIGDLDEAARAHGLRADRLEDRRQRSKDRKVADEAAARVRMAHLLDTLHARDDDEAAAAAREAA